jgi:hypothetical protein
MTNHANVTNVPAAHYSLSSVNFRVGALIAAVTLAAATLFGAASLADRAAVEPMRAQVAAPVMNIIVVSATRLVPKVVAADAANDRATSATATSRIKAI